MVWPCSKKGGKRFYQKGKDMAVEGRRNRERQRIKWMDSVGGRFKRNGTTTCRGPE